MCETKKWQFSDSSFLKKDFFMVSYTLRQHSENLWIVNKNKNIWGCQETLTDFFSPSSLINSSRKWSTHKSTLKVIDSCSSVSNQPHRWETVWHLNQTKGPKIQPQAHCPSVLMSPVQYQQTTLCRSIDWSVCQQKPPQPFVTSVLASPACLWVFV